MGAESSAVALFATRVTATGADLSLQGAAAWVRTVAGRPEALALNRGTRLALGGQILAEASALLDVTVQLGKDATLAHVSASAPCEVTLAVGEHRQMTLDGQAAANTTVSAGRATVRLSPGAHALQFR